MKFEDAMLIDVRVGEENPRRLKMLALKYMRLLNPQSC
jgi:hypothetical protein